MFVVALGSASAPGGSGLRGKFSAKREFHTNDFRSEYAKVMVMQNVSIMCQVEPSMFEGLGRQFFLGTDVFVPS